MELSHKLKALLSPFRYTEASDGGIRILRLLDKSATTAIVPEGVTEIGSHAFEDARTLEKLYLPATLKRIGSMVFWGCRSLTEIHLGSIDSYIQVEFGDYLSYPVDFYENGKLITSYTFPEGTLSISDGAFSGMGSLKEVILPEGMTHIGRYAFSYCGLTSITLPKSLKTLGSYAFWSNHNLTEAELPRSVRVLSYAAFGCCLNLSRIRLYGTLTVIESEALLHTALTEIDIPEGVERIGDNVFRDCQKLTRVSIPDTVEHIGDYAFYHCPALAEVKLETGLKRIGNSAFADCASLRELTVPRSVTSIGHSAFAGNPSLEKIYLPPYDVALGSDILANCPSLFEVSTDGYVYLNGKLLKLIPYEDRMGTVDMSVEDASFLATLPIPKQVDHFRLKVLKIREIDECEAGRSLLMKALMQSDVESLIVKGGVIVGVFVDGTNVLAGETKQTYYSEDNNGAGTKGLREYATLMLVRFENEEE